MFSMRLFIVVTFRVICMARVSFMRGGGIIGGWKEAVQDGFR